MRILAVTAFAVLVVGCGGKAFVDDGGDGGSTTDGGTSDGANGNDAGACGAPPPSCVPLTATTCQLDCNTCSCVGNSWGCTALGCVEPVCPSAPPKDGTYCQMNSQSCTFGPGCGPQCTCENHAWKCLYPPCPPPVCPPSPPSGSCGGEVGLQCSWGSGCNTTKCDCVQTGNGATWECSGTACVDAGHTGDGGH